MVPRRIGQRLPAPAAAAASVVHLCLLTAASPSAGADAASGGPPAATIALAPAGRSSASAPADRGATRERGTSREEQRTRSRWLAFPWLGTTAGEWPGFGFVAELSQDEGGGPWRHRRWSLRTFASATGAQEHELRFAGRGLLGADMDADMDMEVAVGLMATRRRNFCGLGNLVTCAPASAAEALAALPPDAGVTTLDVQRYYQMRYVKPHAEVRFGGPLDNRLPGLAWLAGWRLALLLPGEAGDWAPLPGTLYAQRFPEGERGVLSVPWAGLLWDRRDDPLWPTKGLRAAFSAEASSPLTGSHWSFVGLHAAVAGYATNRRWQNHVWALHLIGDVRVGAMPTEVLAEVGGQRPMAAFGGPWLGRGFRDRRFLGEQKLLAQLEWRARIARIDVEQHHAHVSLVYFVDAGVLHSRSDAPAASPAGTAPGARWPRVLLGLGGGLRVVLDDAWMWRIELALSPQESRGPFLYSPLGTMF